VDLPADRNDLALELLWKIGPEGLLQAREGGAAGPRMDLATLPGVLRGTVSDWPPNPDESKEPVRGLARAFRDAALREEVARSRLRGPEFALCVPAGVCFASVSADCDGNDRLTAGDLLGFYGVTDLLSSHGPQPVMLRAGEIRAVDLALTAQLNAELKPEALTPAQR
jgi:hypothetical protein